MVELKITGCANCKLWLFCEWECSTCTHPNAPEYNEIDVESGGLNPTTPEWCPLKSEPLIISYEEKS